MQINNLPNKTNMQAWLSDNHTLQPKIGLTQAMDCAEPRLFTLYTHDCHTIL